MTFDLRTHKFVRKPNGIFIYVVIKWKYYSKAMDSFGLRQKIYREKK